MLCVLSCDIMMQPWSRSRTIKIICFNGCCWLLRTFFSIPASVNCNCASTLSHHTYICLCLSINLYLQSFSPLTIFEKNQCESGSAISKIAHPAWERTNEKKTEWRAIFANHLCSCYKWKKGTFFFFHSWLLFIRSSNSRTLCNIMFQRADAGVMFCSCLQFSIASYATFCRSRLLLGRLWLSQRHKTEQKAPAYKITTTQTAQTIQPLTIHIAKRKKRASTISAVPCFYREMHFNNSNKC